MGPISAFTAMKQVETSIKGVLRRVDVQMLNPAERKIVAELRINCNDARLDIRDAEYAETSDDYKRNSRDAKKRIKHIVDAILTLSQQGMFSPIEVAELTAKLELIGSSL